MPFSRRRTLLRGLAGALIAPALAPLLPPFTKGHAMGAETSLPQAGRDLPIPASWTGVTGALARDDGEPLPQGTLRRYRSDDSPAPPASVRAQMDLFARLADLPAGPDGSDVTAAAAARGVTIDALAAALFGPGKFTRPTVILGYRLGSAQPGFALARIAVDRPEAAVRVTLCGLGPGRRVTLAHLATAHPAQFSALLAVVCPIDG